MRPIRILDIDVDVRTGADGVLYLRSPHALGEYPVRLTDRLDHWAQVAPDLTFLADRGPDGEWRRVSYREARCRARSIAQALLNRGLSADRPIAILSGNSVEHGLLALGAMYAGVYYAPVAPAYSQHATNDYAALRRVFEVVQPALVFADNGPAFEAAITAVASPQAEVVCVKAPVSRAWTPFETLERTTPTPAVEAAIARVNADTIAKILFTSGSTGKPKGVINTQRMLCANQEQMRAVMQFLGDEPPILCDWLPWNHTAGGNHNFGLALYNGGTLYIDEGKTTPALFEATLRNLREIPCTGHFTVPRFYEMLLPHLREDAQLREVFFRNLKLIFYAAAGLGQRFWDQLREVSIAACGEELLIMTGMGATETAPFLMSTGPRGAFAGMIGLPAPGVEMKLVPAGEKLEARVRGPNITPGYLRDPELTRAAFDADGYYCTGDAVAFADPANPRQGLVFEGRLAEDFKLSTGTWVSVGPLRSRLLAQGEGFVQDVVIAAPDRDFVSALIFPNLALCRSLSGLDTASIPDVLSHPTVRARFQSILSGLASRNTGSSTFIARAIVVDEPPSVAAREITDKGSLNQKAVLVHRRSLVDALYEPKPSPHVISL